MSLYSYQGSYPIPVPFRIKLSSGFTRTDPTTFTQEELEDAGYTGPYEEPVYDSTIETLSWNGTEYVKRPYNTEEIEAQWDIIRLERDRLLKESDYTQISDYDLGIENREEWRVYRQILRDLPETQTNPFDISWPLMPVS
jgi:hypothetical protein